MAGKQPSAAELAHYFESFPRFCGLLKVQPKKGGERIPFTLTRTQALFTRQRTTRDIICKGRQVRVTTVEAARDLWWFLTKTGARVVVICQSQDDQGPLKDIAYKFRVFIDSLRERGVLLKFGTESATEWSLPDRDATLRIIQAGASENAAGKKGRGGTVNRLHLTEASTWEHGVETFNSIAESVPRDGSEIVNESTPKGAAGFYYDQWQAAKEGRSEYTPHFFGWWLETDYALALDVGEKVEPANDVEAKLLRDGAKVENLKWRRWKIRERGGDETLVNQEFPNDDVSCFLVSGRTFFDQQVTAALLAKAPKPIERLPIRSAGAHGELRIHHPPQPGREYVVSCDPSEGTGGDPSAIQVYERGTGRHMATLDGQLRPWECARALVGVANRYGGALIAVERNNHGHAVLQALANEQGYRNVFVDSDGKQGWLTVETTRTAALDVIEQAHRAGNWKPLDTAVIGELRTFIVNDRDKAEASAGNHDDHVMCAAIGWNVICRQQTRRAFGRFQA